MIHDNSDLGEVQISNDVLAVISAMAAMEVDGVAGYGRKHHSRACFKTWNEETYLKGVRVDVVDNTVMVDLSIILRINENIVTISKKVQDKVKTTVENMTGMEVANVNVNIASVATNLNKLDFFRVSVTDTLFDILVRLILSNFRRKYEQS